MATIPDQRTLGRVQMTGRQPGIQGPSYVDPLEGIPEALREQAKIQLEKEVADAKTEFYLAKTEIDGRIEDDTDYETMVPRYEEETTEALSNAMANISNARYRDSFANEAQLRLAQTREQIGNIARQRESEQVVASMNQSIDDISKSIISGKGNVRDANEAVSAMVQSAINAGHITAEVGQKRIQSYKEDSFKGRVQAMPAADQLNVLKTPLAEEVLDAAEISIIRKQAEAEQREARNRYIVEQGTALGQQAADMPNPQDRIDFIRGITDARMRRRPSATMSSELSVIDAQEREATINFVDTTLQEAWRGGPMTVDQWYLSQQDSAGGPIQPLPPSAENALRKALGELPSVGYNAGFEKVMLETWDGGRGNVDAAYEYLMDNYALLDKSQASDWYKKLRGDPVLSNSETYTKIYSALNDQQKAVFFQYVENWQQTFLVDHDRYPSETEARAAMQTGASIALGRDVSPPGIMNVFRSRTIDELEYGEQADRILFDVGYGYQERNKEDWSRRIRVMNAALAEVGGNEALLRQKLPQITRQLAGQVEQPAVSVKPKSGPAAEQKAEPAAEPKDILVPEHESPEAFLRDDPDTFYRTKKSMMGRRGYGGKITPKDVWIQYEGLPATFGIENPWIYDAASWSDRIFIEPLRQSARGNQIIGEAVVDVVGPALTRRDVGDQFTGTLDAKNVGDLKRRYPEQYDTLARRARVADRRAPQSKIDKEVWRMYQDLANAR